MGCASSMSLVLNNTNNSIFLGAVTLSYFSVSKPGLDSVFGPRRIYLNIKTDIWTNVDILELERMVETRN